jgi:hypothetical protein
MTHAVANSANCICMAELMQASCGNWQVKKKQSLCCDRCASIWTVNADMFYQVWMQCCLGPRTEEHEYWMSGINYRACFVNFVRKQCRATGGYMSLHYWPAPLRARLVAHVTYPRERWAPGWNSLDMRETLASPTGTVTKPMSFGQLTQGTAGNFRELPKFENKPKIVRFS